MLYILSVLCCCTFDSTFNILIHIIEFFHLRYLIGLGMYIMAKY